MDDGDRLFVDVHQFLRRVSQVFVIGVFMKMECIGKNVTVQKIAAMELMQVKVFQTPS